MTQGNGGAYISQSVLLKLLSSESLFEEFYQRAASHNIIGPDKQDKAAALWAKEFLKDSKRLPTTSELTANFPEVFPVSLEMVSEDFARADLKLRLKNERLKNLLISTADALVYGDVDYSRLAAEAEELAKEDAVIIEPPEALKDFRKRDIPPVQFLVEGFIQREGRNLNTAATGIGKSVMALNLVKAIVTGQKFLGRFEVMRGRCLFIEAESGESSLKGRLLKLMPEVETDDLFVKVVSGFDLCLYSNRKIIETWIEDIKPDLLVLDPLCYIASSDLNDGQEVTKLTGYLNTLIERYHLAILLLHHHRKRQKGEHITGESAAGSFRLGGWADTHIVLQGPPEAIICSFEKARNCGRPKSFLMALNPDTLSMEYLRDVGPRYDEGTLEKVFKACGKDKVSQRELIDKAKELDACSERTLRQLIKASQHFTKEKVGKDVIIERTVASLQMRSLQTSEAKNTDDCKDCKMGKEQMACEPELTDEASIKRLLSQVTG